MKSKNIISTQSVVGDKLIYHENNKTEDLYKVALDKDKDGQELKLKLERLKDKVKVKVEKIQKLGDLEYDEDCDYCMKNPFTLDAIETKKSIEDMTKHTLKREIVK